MPKPDSLTLGITYDGYDYRVPSPDACEEGAYYANDIEDAVLTAKQMYRDVTSYLDVICNYVDNHPH